MPVPVRIVVRLVAAGADLNVRSNSGTGIIQKLLMPMRKELLESSNWLCVVMALRFLFSKAHADMKLISQNFSLPTTPTIHLCLLLNFRCATPTHLAWCLKSVELSCGLLQRERT